MNLPHGFVQPLFLGKAIGGLSAALALSVLAGCTGIKPDVPVQTPMVRHDDPYARSDLDELLGFGADLDGATPSDRTEVCRTLLKRQRDASSPEVKTGIQLHLMAARLFSGTCGDIPKILGGVDAMTAQDLPDGRVRQWVAVQAQALKRMDRQSKQRVMSGRKQKQAQREQASAILPKEVKMARKPMPTKEPHDKGDGEARALRGKLEAIRSMEERLDDAGGGRGS